MASKLICFVTLWTTARQASVLLVITPAVFVCIFPGWLWAISVMSLCLVSTVHIIYPYFCPDPDHARMFHLANSPIVRVL